jgi:carbonic anhydrase
MRANQSEAGDMADLTHLIAQNRSWADDRLQRDPHFFSRLARQQAPRYMWIGCSDSRVPANEIVGLAPGEMFVHRNVANIVVHADLNCLSAVQYAVEVLRVTDVIVCGHYCCGGVLAALRNERLGLSDNWLRHVQDVRRRHRDEIDALPTETAAHNRLCELNVVEQALNVARTTPVREAWERGQPLAVHGWIYDVGDGLIRDLEVTMTADSDDATRAAQRLPTPG